MQEKTFNRENLSYAKIVKSVSILEKDYMIIKLKDFAKSESKSSDLKINLFNLLKKSSKMH